MSRPFSKRRGFTLLEMTVTLSIIAIVLTIILRNQSAYTESAGLTNLADDVASRVSEAQAYGIAVKESSPGTADFSGAYGVSLTLLAGSGNLLYLTFIDKNANGVYDGTTACATGGANECLEKIDILRGNYLDSFCAITSAGSSDCTTVRRADVSFRRPAPQAALSLFNSAGQSYAPSGLLGVKIVFKSPKGLSRSVSIYLNGQVSVQ